MYDEINKNIVGEYNENKEKIEKIEEKIKQENKNTFLGRIITAGKISLTVYGLGIASYILAPTLLVGVWPLVMTGTVLSGFIGEKIIYHYRNKNHDKTTCLESEKKSLKLGGEKEQLETQNEVLEKEKEYLDSEVKMNKYRQNEGDVFLDNDEKRYEKDLKINYDKLNSLVMKNHLKINKGNLPIRIILDIEGLAVGAGSFLMLSIPLLENGNNYFITSGFVLSSLVSGYAVDSYFRDVDKAVSSLEENDDIRGNINDTINDTAICKLLDDKQKVLTKRR